MGKFIASVFFIVTILLVSCSPNNELTGINTVVEAESNTDSYLFSELLNAVRSAVAEPDGTAKSVLNTWKSINKDVYALIKIDSFGIYEPVVAATESNDQWLRVNIYGDDDIAGCTFLDYRCASGMAPINLIHGHNLMDGTMFSRLPDLLTLSSCNEAPIVELYTESGWLSYKIFSIMSVDSTEEAIPVDVAMSETDVEKIAIDLLSRSLVPDGQILTNDILILNTCWYGPSGIERNLHCIVSASRV